MDWWKRESMRLRFDSNSLNLEIFSWTYSNCAFSNDMDNWQCHTSPIRKKRFIISGCNPICKNCTSCYNDFPATSKEIDRQSITTQRTLKYLLQVPLSFFGLPIMKFRKAYKWLSLVLPELAEIPIFTECGHVFNLGNRRILQWQLHCFSLLLKW